MSGPSSQGVLRHSEDRRTLAFAAVFFGLVAVQFAVDRPLWASVLLWLATCLFAFVGAVTTHNVIHTPMFRRPWMNDVWRVVQTWWYGQPVSFFVPVHNHSHHKYAQTRKDLTRTTKVTYRWQLLNLLMGIQWQRAAARDCKAYFAVQKQKGRKIAQQLSWELRGLVVFYLALLIIDWKTTLICVALPHQIGGACIRAINFLQHDGCDYDPEGYNHSRNFTGPVFNWLFLNNGYHTVHHMRPGWHWSTLPERHAELVVGRIHPALDVRNVLTFSWRFLIWPGHRVRYDGAPYETVPGGEGPDEPWDFSVEANYDVAFGGGGDPRRQVG